MTSRLWGAFSACVFTLTIVPTANAALIGRLPATSGGTDYQAYYDDDMDITWLADANLAASNQFGFPVQDPNGLFNRQAINESGSMTVSNAKRWIDAMNDVNYLGYNDWRLPTSVQFDPNCSNQSPAYNYSSGYGCTASEMSHLSTIEGITVTTPGPFSNFQSSKVYWSSTVDPIAPSGFIFSFDFNDGRKRSSSTDHGNENFALVVRSGNIVPLPAAAWLFGSGLLGLIGFAKRKAA